jgi:membrane-associated phospholipid phosphatase
MHSFEIRMKWRPFLLWNGTALTLLLSWVFPPTRALWDILDKSVFLCLNSSLVSHPFAQIFWAIANFKPVDIMGAVFMTGFFGIYIMEAEGKERAKRISQLIYGLIWGEIGILFTKHFVDAWIEGSGLARECPTLSFPKAVMLSGAIPWLRVKDFSYSCFPGDHAEILFQWVAFVWFFCRARYGLVALVWAIFFMLPRLVAGAHWLSDAVVGSTVIVSLLVSLATCTPLYGQGMNLIMSVVTKIFGYEKAPAQKEQTYECV